MTWRQISDDVALMSFPWRTLGMVERTMQEFGTRRSSGSPRRNYFIE